MAFLKFVALSLWVSSIRRSSSNGHCWRTLAVRMYLSKTFLSDTYALESILKFENVSRLYICDFIACFINGGRYRF